jgi:putative sterol carrier protein
MLQCCHWASDGVLKQFPINNVNKKEGGRMTFKIVQELIDYLSNNFDPEKTGDINAVIQYHISGDEGGDWNITIKEGKCRIEEGVKDSPVVTFKMSGETWLGLANKTVNPMMAFTTGRLRVKGDLTLAQKVPKFFNL